MTEHAMTMPTAQSRPEPEVAIMIAGILKKTTFPTETERQFKKAQQMAREGIYGLCPNCGKTNSAKELRIRPLKCSNPECGANLTE